MSDELLHELSIRHRAPVAYRKLLSLGFDAVPLARLGLQHPDAAVRRHCCAFLDHFLVAAALPDLLALLNDPDSAVRITALHTLACDRCKEGACRPEESEILPQALHALRHDTDAHVRAMAVEVVGLFVHTNSGAQCALLESAKEDTSPTVRKKAGWYAPGGPIFRRTAAKKKARQ